MRKIMSGSLGAALCAVILLAAQRTGSGQDLEEAGALNTKVMELYNAEQYLEAIPLAQRALSIRERALGPDHRDLASSLANLATLYTTQKRFVEAEALYKRSVAIRERNFGFRGPGSHADAQRLGADL